MQLFLILWMLIHEVVCSKSCTSQFCPPLLKKHKLTLDRDLPLKFVGLDEKNGCICTESPNVYTLCYNADDKTVPCVAYPKNLQLNTTALILKSTYITKLSRGDFTKLAHLETLVIDSNVKLSDVEPFTFESMLYLKSLSFVFNPSLTHFDANVFHGLVSLRELSLIKNGFNCVKTLAASLVPQTVPKLLKLNLNDNVFGNISATDFEPMAGSTLEELDMTLNRIEFIEPSTLKPLTNLSTLRIGDNRFTLMTLINLLNETFRSGVDLRLLDLYSTGLRVSVPTALLEIIAASNVTSLILGRNQFDSLENGTFPVQMPNLIYLDLKDVSVQKIDDRAFSNFPNLKTLVLSRNKLSYFGASQFLPNLTYLDLQENTDVYGSEFFLTRSALSKMSLQYLDLQFTRLIYLTKTDFGLMPHLRILNLNNCSIIKVENGTFKGLSGLVFLSLEYNKFFRVWLVYDFDMFGGLENLEVLLLGGNEITAITTASGRYLLKYLKNLKHLSLNRNALQSLSAEDFASLTKLEVLDISYNYITSWDSRVFLRANLKRFYGSVNKIAYLSDAMLEDFANLTYMEMIHNSFICTCAVKKGMSFNREALSRFLVLVEDSELLCIRPSFQSFQDFLQRVIDFTFSCDSDKISIVLFAPLVITIVIFLVLIVLIYLYRWHVRYWLFLVRLQLIRKGRIRNRKQRNGYANYQYDAFVSYCNQDRNFVVRLVRMLENHEPFLKMCVYERDFQVGSFISESVLEHMARSRKTVLVVSDAYAKSYWCNWESQIAEHHRLYFDYSNGVDGFDDSLVVVKLGPIDESHLNPSLRYLLKTRIYLQWEVEDDKQKVFWERIRQFLEPPRNSISQCTHL